MRFLFVVKFRVQNGKNNGFGSIKSFKTVAKSPKAAAQKMHKKGAQILSVRKAKRLAP